MGISTEYADMGPIVIDLETAGLPNAADYLDPVQPDKRLTDKAKIAADIEAKTAEQLAMCSLDWNVGRIVAMAWWAEETTQAICCQDEASEKAGLQSLWRDVKHRTIVGFNIKAFDLRFLIRRSQLLGVKYPDLDMGKYTKRGVVDLYQELTFYDGLYDKGAMRRNLKAFCRRFGIPVNDAIKGEDVPKLVAAGEWEKVLTHVRADVEMTVALARKLGVIQSAQEMVL